VRESTADWLNPILDRAKGQLDDADLRALMAQATMPVKEAMVSPIMEELANGAIDWIRFGQLCRDRLGWEDYPEWPTD